MKDRDVQSVLINEKNWQDIVRDIKKFPFRISEIYSLNQSIALSKVSFKYAIEGKETYYNGSQELTLRTGEYLIASNQSYCEVNIHEHQTQDLGVCVDLNLDYLQQAVHAFLQPNQYVFEHDKHNYFINDSLFIRYQSNREFHRYMQFLFSIIKSGEYQSLQEMECEFIRHFLFHQTSNLLAYKKIPAIRKSTRAELYAKMIQAKNILHDSVNQNLSMAELSKQILLSEYRLYHLFKATFQISPHKYLLQLKLDKAMELYRTKKYTWTDIAEQLQFADVQTFSKLFRKYFRMNPSEYGK